MISGKPMVFCPKQEIPARRSSSSNRFDLFISRLDNISLSLSNTASIKLSQATTFIKTPIQPILFKLRHPVAIVAYVKVSFF